MVDRGDFPGSLRRRYEAVTPERRRTLYAVRRHLGYGPEEWDGLPWWQQRLMLDGLNEEFAPAEDARPEPVDLDDAGLAAHGIKVT